MLGAPAASPVEGKYAGLTGEVKAGERSGRSLSMGLNLENAHCHLHIDWSRVHRGFLLRQEDDLRSLYFADARQDVVFSLSLARNAGHFDQGAQEPFEQVWARLGVEPNTTRKSGT